MLRAADVRFGYGGTRVIDGVSLTVPAGRVVGILGPNGSGKTTMLRLLAGTRRPDSGRVSIGERELNTIPRHELARSLAVVPQDTHLAFDYSVIEVVLMGRYPHLRALEIEGPADLAIARAAMDATGTSALERRSFETLSGGERQRVVIASALAQLAAREDGRSKTEDERLKILLLDEPTASLDLAYQLEVAGLITDLNTRQALTVVVSTHDLSFAAAVCHELVLLRAGRVIASGAVDDVLTAANIRALYDVDAEVTRQSGRLVVVPHRHIKPS